ncbi:5-(carboxyamino)imidazole ribonucleotide mutase [Longimonas sp.]|uniref:5-(carboxyamino)imidazole ribonucleotide mutase n=1 Tax=Longimonas sp. TaxID=2039626 RepID=UPI0033653494
MPSTTMPSTEDTPLVGIAMGSESDLPVMRDAAAILHAFDVPYEMRVLSAHRTPAAMHEYAETAAERGLKVIVAGAGGAAHLPGMIAASTPLPVLGVPVKTSTLNGLDSLLSVVQMPGGVPVGTLAINGAKNAALLAIQILGTHDADLQAAMKAYKSDLVDTVDGMDARVRAFDPTEEAS